MKSTRILPCMVVVLFLVGLSIVPVYISTDTTRPQETTLELNDEKEIRNSALPLDEEIRIALLNEMNTTNPVYDDSSSYLTNEYSYLVRLLMDAGFDVTNITLSDIQQHKLITADYDIFLLADNLPNANISNYIMDFWLGGGAILGFDSAAVYLNYAGMLPRESAGSSGYETYWSNEYMSTCEIFERHPVTKAYAHGAPLDSYVGTWAAYNWTALQSTSIANSLTRLATNEMDENQTHAIAHSPKDMGGKVVHIGIPIVPLNGTWNQMVIDAVYWLCPQPKARIVFDYSHFPYSTIDSWDTTPGATVGYYSVWRNDLVMRGYQVDKLFASTEGNLTGNRLASYHTLIEVIPDEDEGVNFTQAEVDAVKGWINTGGALLAIGDGWQLSIIAPDQMLNYLLSPYNVKINEGGYSGSLVGAITEEQFHPTTEGCTELYIRYTGYINHSSTGFPLWYEKGNCYAAGDTYGEGRIIVTSDVDYLRNSYITIQDNRDFAINMINWLSAAKARVLYYTTEPNSMNYYRTPGALSLDDFGLNYFLTYSDAFMNLSLSEYEWDLVILDGPYYSMDSYYDDILEYVLEGGKLIMSEYFAMTDQYHPLWAALGIRIIEEIGNNRTLSIWDMSHPMIVAPNHYAAANLISTIDYGSEGTLLEPFANATGLVGNSTTYQTNQSLVVLRNDRKTIFNGFLIDQFQGDHDDSTYMDAYEFWQNEISYLMYYDDTPTIDSPADKTIEAGSSTDSIVWTPNSSRPYSYMVTRDYALYEEGPWDGSPISINLNEAVLGSVLFIVMVWDTYGYMIEDAVTVSVEDHTAPTILQAPANLEYQEGLSEHLLNWSASDLFPDFYKAYVNGTLRDSGPWDGSNISIDVGGLAEGIYNVTLVLNDTSSNQVSSTVYLTVTGDTTSPTTLTETTDTGTTGTANPPPDGDIMIIILVIIAAVVVIVILVIMMTRRKE